MKLLQSLRLMSRKMKFRCCIEKSLIELTGDGVDGRVDELQVLVVPSLDPHFVVMASVLDERHAALVQVGARRVEVRVAALCRIQTTMVLAPENFQF